jgi:hypothetical protein
LVLYTSLLILKNIDLTNQNWIAISHIDGTNKFNKNNFPLVVFGSRNINKTFRPLVFYVTSHEEMEDYTNSYKSCYQLKIDFKPTFKIQDASTSESGAAIIVFGSNISILIMSCTMLLRTLAKI